MGVWGWNELTHDGSSFVTIHGTVPTILKPDGSVASPDYSGDGATDDSDWCFHVVPDADSAWCLVDPRFPGQITYAESGAARTHVGAIECEFEPGSIIDHSTGQLGRSAETFEKLVAPLAGWQATVQGYWARDRSHSWDGDTSIDVDLGRGDRGKLEIHPVVAVLARGPIAGNAGQGWTQDVRFFAVCDGSADDKRRSLLEAALDLPGALGTHVPHRNESHRVQIDYDPGAQYGRLVHLDGRTEWDNCHHFEYQHMGSTGIRFIAETGSVSDGQGFMCMAATLHFATH